MKKVILVHGALHSASCWEKIIPTLEKENLSVDAPNLLGHGPAIKKYWPLTLDAHVQQLITLAEASKEPAVLVAHSFGGVPATIAASRRPELFEKIIYLTAMVPGSGKGCGLTFMANAIGWSFFLRGRYRPCLGFGTYGPKFMKSVMYSECGDCSLEEIGRYSSRQPLRTLLTGYTVDSEKLSSIKKHFIECTKDKTISIQIQKMMQKNQELETVTTLDTDHSPMRTAPNKLERALLPLIMG